MWVLLKMDETIVGTNTFNRHKNPQRITNLVFQMLLLWSMVAFIISRYQFNTGIIYILTWGYLYYNVLFIVLLDSANFWLFDKTSCLWQSYHPVTNIPGFWVIEPVSCFLLFYFTVGSLRCIKQFVKSLIWLRIVGSELNKHCAEITL